MIRFLLFLFFPLLLFAEKPELLLLKTYDENIHNIDGWLMSEKLDGVRAYWDGKKLLSRNGNEFSVPDWFTKDYPPFPLDGELWTKRGDFENIVSITSQKKNSELFREVSYNIFEVPFQKDGLLKRLEILENYLKKHPNTTIRIIKQIACKDKNHLKIFLDDIEKKGGEGAVIRDPDAPYIAQRTSQALKVKSFKDAECKVVGYKDGKGKYTGFLGSIVCSFENGVLLNIGSGFTDEQRKSPPPMGSTITFKYQELTQKGVPRFPVFLRVRKEW